MLSGFRVEAVLQPRNAADIARLSLRSLHLPSGRPVKGTTSCNRAGLTAAFSQWLLDGNDLQSFLDEPPFAVERFVSLLTGY